jgi:hypothetical protein
MRLLVQSLFKACSDFKRQDQSEPLGRRGRIGLGGLLRLWAFKPPTISVSGFRLGPCQRARIDSVSVVML